VLKDGACAARVEHLHPRDHVARVQQVDLFGADVRAGGITEEAGKFVRQLEAEFREEAHAPVLLREEANLPIRAQRGKDQRLAGELGIRCRRLLELLLHASDDLLHRIDLAERLRPRGIP